MTSRIITIMVGLLLFPAITVYGYGKTTRSDTIVRVNALKEVEVLGFGADRNLKAPEMGQISLSNTKITNLPVLFGEPDVVKVLQTLPGVSQGVEGFTGLYVRGGDNDQNLFLYQGLPLYHVSHLGGIFSSFNVPTVGRVDFYKSSFPSRYGGRISSITDILMKRSDFEQFHGRFSIGLLCANVFLTGPIVKERTAFTIGARRSWIDAVSSPTLAIVNAIGKKNGKKQIFGYDFTDVNLRLDHKFNSAMSTYIVGYYGYDRLKIGKREFESENRNYHYGYDDDREPTNRFFDENTNRLAWGNWGVLGAFEWHLGPGTWSTSVYYSHYSSSYRQEREYQSDMDEPDTYGYNKSHTRNSIADIGVKTAYVADFSKTYRFRTGLEYTNHYYLPEWLLNQFYSNGVGSEDRNSNAHLYANEYAGYVDNTLNFSDKVAFNIGLRASAYHVQRHTFTDIEPRASVKFAVGENYSIKASYARMHQYVQQISNNYINLPTDLWQPVTASFKPIRSDQYSMGVYGNLPWAMYFSVEGWYKTMSNLLEYRDGVSVLNPHLYWEDKLTSGKGWSYGVDIAVTKDVGKITGTVGYGLLWNWRKFDELNLGNKFPAKFDNRHKININVAYKLNERFNFNAGWTYMTGNRLTLSMYNYDIPGSLFPDAPTVGPPGYGNEIDGLNYYPTRNNVRLPAYHRLDLGMTIHRNYRKGRSGEWNVSLYNAYCHMNVLTVKKDNENNVAFTPDKENWHRAFKTLSLIPIIPSVSYTYSF